MGRIGTHPAVMDSRPLRPKACQEEKSRKNVQLWYAFERFDLDGEVDGIEEMPLSLVATDGVATKQKWMERMHEPRGWMD